MTQIDKTVALVVIIALTTYVVTNMSFFDTSILAMSDTGIENFIGNNTNQETGLLLELNAKNYKKGSLLFGNSKWNKEPTVHNGNHLKITGQKLSGVIKNDKIKNMEAFSAVLKCSPNNVNEGIDGVFSRNMNVLNCYSSFSLYRNQELILDISIPSQNTIGNMCIKLGKDNTGIKSEWIKMEGKILPLSKISYYTITHRQVGGIWVIEVYYDDTVVASLQLKHSLLKNIENNEDLFFNFNEDGRWSTNFYFLKIYKLSMSKENIVNAITIDKKINNKMISGLTDGFSNYSDGGGSSGASGMGNDVGNKLEQLKKRFIEKFMEKVKYDCLLRMRLHEQFFKDGEVENEYNKCTNTANNECTRKKIEERFNSFNGNILKIKNYLKRLTTFVDENITQFKNYDPTAFFDRNVRQYVIYVYYKSNMSDKVGYFGRREHGRDILQVRNIFLENFPGIVLPAIFDKNYKKCFRRPRNNRNCPFALNYMNPCRRNECSGVRWGRKGQRIGRLPPGCKESINHYCSLPGVALVDNACSCWNPVNARTPRCKTFRQQFVNNKIESSCSVDIFNIEDHPNFKNYVRKDNIPCFGCNL